jgi:tetratricopeptide (TPR) repeat protein
LGDCPPEQLPELQNGIQKAKLAGSQLLGTNLGNLALAASRVGAWKEAVDAYRSTLLFIERFTPSFADSNIVFCNVCLALLHASGSPDEAVALSAAVLERARNRQHGAVEQFTSDMSAEALVAKGDVQGAILRLEASLALATKSHGYVETREVCRLLPRLYLQANPTDKIAQRKAASVIKKGRWLVKKGHGDKRPLVELSEAILFAAQGKPARADARFEQALQTARAQGARFYVYDILLQRGLMLKKRGDGANARRDIDEARALAASCGDQYVTKLCDDALL